MYFFTCEISISFHCGREEGGESLQVTPIPLQPAGSAAQARQPRHLCGGWVSCASQALLDHTGSEKLKATPHLPWTLFDQCLLQPDLPGNHIPTQQTKQPAWLNTPQWEYSRAGSPLRQFNCGVVSITMAATHHNGSCPVPGIPWSAP